jgi:hypothetical protein
MHHICLLALELPSQRAHRYRDHRSTLLTVAEYRAEGTSHKIDVAGFLLLSIGTFFLTFALVEDKKLGCGSAPILGSGRYRALYCNRTATGALRYGTQRTIRTSQGWISGLTKGSHGTQRYPPEYTSAAFTWQRSLVRTQHRPL